MPPVGVGVEASFSAELLKLRKWPAVWWVFAAAVTAVPVLAYAAPIVGYLAGIAGPSRLVAALPGRLTETAAVGDGPVGAACAYAIGVLSVGGEYRWGTLRAALTQGPSRGGVLAGKLAALGVVLLGLALARLASAALAATGFVASVTGGAADGVALSGTGGAARAPAAHAWPAGDAWAAWPSAPALTAGLAAGWLILAMWTALGVLAAFAVRDTALPLGAGAAWFLGVTFPGLLAGAGSCVLRLLRSALPGTNAVHLAASLPEHAPAVIPSAGGRSALIVAGYLVAAIALSTLFLRRRDAA